MNKPKSLFEEIKDRINKYFEKTGSRPKKIIIGQKEEKQIIKEAIARACLPRTISSIQGYYIYGIKIQVTNIDSMLKLY